MRNFSLLTLCFLITAAVVVAQDSPKTDSSGGSLKGQVDAAVKDLTAGDFEIREKAQSRLRKLGVKAIPYLRSHVNHTDPEARLRIRNLLNPPQETSPLQREEAGADSSPSRRKPVRPNNPGIELDPFDVLRRGDLFGGSGSGHQGFERIQRELQEQLEKIMRSPRSGMPDSGSDHGSNSVRSTISLSTPELGRVRMERVGEAINLTVKPPNGASQTFKARSVEAFKAAHPKVYEQLKNTGIFQQQGFARSWSFSFGGGQPLSPFGPRPAPRRSTAPLDPRGSSSSDPDAAPTKPSPLKRSARKPTRSPSKPKLGATVRERPFKNGADLVVEGVAPNTVASSLGLRVGDVIMRVNGRSVRSMDELQQSVEAIRPDAMWSLWVRRGGVVRLLANDGCAEAPLPVPKKRASRDV